MSTDGDSARATTWVIAAGAEFAGRPGPLEIAGCPQCGLPAEIVDRAVATSTGGPVGLVRMMCVHRHWFMMIDDRLPAA